MHTFIKNYVYNAGKNVYIINMYVCVRVKNSITNIHPRNFKKISKFPIQREFLDIT